MGMKETFDKKLAYLISMVGFHGLMKIPNDWWDYAYTDKPTTKTGLHGYGTTFRIVSLCKQYEKQYLKKLDDAGIKVLATKDGITYLKK
jgi:hypothetical protein